MIVVVGTNGLQITARYILIVPAHIWEPNAQFAEPVRCTALVGQATGKHLKKIQI